MAACVIDNINPVNVEKIENFINDSSYKEALESSASFNTRLSIERRMRLPFLDSQTGVAQNHSQLFMSKRQRMPGMVPGQIYSYPRPRWRKKRRQYLLNTRPFGRFEAMDESDLHSISQMENPGIMQDNDSKDSQLLKDEVAAKEWYYDDAELLEMDPYDEPDQDSDLDYEESYSRKAKKRRGTGRGRGSGGASVDTPGTPGRKKGGGRGRKRASMHNYEPTPGDPDKPFSCELCGARYKTRPGLTYHYGHSHKEGASDENSREATTPVSGGSGGGGSGGGSASVLSPSVPQPPANGAGGGVASAGPSSPAGGGGASHAGQSSPSSNPGAGSDGETSLSAASSSGNNVYQDSYVSFLNHPAGTPGRRGRPSSNPAANAPQQQQQQQQQQQAPPTLPPNLPVATPPQSDDPQMPVLVPEKIDAPATTSVVAPPPQPPVPTLPPGEKPKATPNPYCDFCLGDAAMNKKTAESEELVSCSDCGRSGHPSCLQFTDNMKISVKKYRWQCIECKCCSVCGTSDNDDQLLFCDDCDRGYHMYCLSPPLNAPPEGSWSCKLCIEEFHKH